MADISASVGKNAKNVERDVQEVQELLDRVPVSEGGPSPAIDIDGWCGQNTNAAILAFQRQQRMAVADGVVDAGKTTINRLNALAAGPGARPVALPDMDPGQLAQQSVPLALKWARAGLEEIRTALGAASNSGGLSSVDSIVQTALAGHFRITDRLGKQRLKQSLRVVEQNFVGAISTLGRAATVFRTVGRKQMAVDFGGRGDAPAYVLPANRTRIQFSQLFHVRTSGQRPGLVWTGDGFGLKCRAAMVLHETIHVVDSRGGGDIYEHGAGYLAMSTDTAIHNAASYPSFGAHVEERSNLPLGPRYGAGRPAD